MGERNPQKQLWSYQVNLDKRVRSDHPLRRIDERLDLDFVRREVAKCYGIIVVRLQLARPHARVHSG
jgi:hypothetical protein